MTEEEVLQKLEIFKNAIISLKSKNVDLENINNQLKIDLENRKNQSENFNREIINKIKEIEESLE